MGFVEKGGSRSYKPWGEWEEGDYVSGIYKELGEDQYGNASYSVLVDDTNISEFKVDEMACLNSCGSMNYKMDTVQIGERIFVEYLKEGVTSKGKFEGKKFHELKVMVDESYKKVASIEEEDDDNSYDSLSDL